MNHKEIEIYQRANRVFELVIDFIGFSTIKDAFTQGYLRGYRDAMEESKDV